MRENLATHWHDRPLGKEFYWQKALFAL